MLRFASSTLPVWTRSLIRCGVASALICLACIPALAQGELVFVRQPVDQAQGVLQDLAPAPDGGAYTIERPATPGATLLSKLRRNGSIEWVVTIANVNLVAIDTDSAGLLSACGDSGGTAVLMRLASDGSEIWRTSIPGGIYSHSLDAVDSGEVFVASAMSYVFGSQISRFSAAGSAIWTTQVGNPYDMRIAATPNGDVYFSQEQQSTVGRLSSTGQLVWSYALYTSGVTVLDNCIDPLGSAIFCGTAGGATFGSPVGINGSDAVVFRVLPGGAVNWIRRFGSPFNDSAQRIIPNGNSFLVAGLTDGRFGGPPAGSTDAWACDIDALGNMDWANQIGSVSSEDVKALSSDGSGGLFVLGNGGPIPGTGATAGGQWLARFGYFDCFTDADGDTFGEDGDTVLSATACSNGLSFLDTDCDDTRAYVFPGAAELCDGLDNNCDGTIDEGFISTYCTSGTSTNGCVATMSSQGTPSTTAGSGFQVICSNVEGQRYGLILYGTTPGGALWAINGTSYICVAPPQGRTDSQTSGGTLGACDGTLSIDFNLYLATHPNSVGAPYSPGQYLYAQGWYRDPAAPKGTNLSNGIQFALCN